MRPVSKAAPIPAVRPRSLPRAQALLARQLSPPPRKEPGGKQNPDFHLLRSGSARPRRPHGITPFAPTWGPKGGKKKHPTEQNYTFNLEKLGGPSRHRAPSPLPPSALTSTGCKSGSYLITQFIFHSPHKLL